MNSTIGPDACSPLVEFIYEAIAVLESDLLMISANGVEAEDDVKAFKQRYPFAFQQSAEEPEEQAVLTRPQPPAERRSPPSLRPMNRPAVPEPVPAAPAEPDRGNSPERCRRRLAKPQSSAVAPERVRAERGRADFAKSEPMSRFRVEAVAMNRGRRSEQLESAENRVRSKRTSSMMSSTWSRRLPKPSLRRF